MKRMNNQLSGCERSLGFTLIELLIVVVVLGIIMGIALPSYQNHVTKTHRTAAKACLSEYANYMERFYTTHMRFDDGSENHQLPTLECASNGNTGRFYSYNVDAKANAYTLSASAIGAQASRDVMCLKLTLDHKGKKDVDGGNTQDCW